MSNFQIVIDCTTDSGAYWFMDARYECELLGVVTDEVESALIAASQGHRSRLIRVTGSRLVKTAEFEYTS